MRRTIAKRKDGKKKHTEASSASEESEEDPTPKVKNMFANRPDELIKNLKKHMSDVIHDDYYHMVQGAPIVTRIMELGQKCINGDYTMSDVLGEADIADPAE